MKKIVKLLALILSLVFCVSLFPAELIDINAEAASYSSHVYMIMTNPGEDCRTQMRIGWHSDYLYEDCYLEYTTADDEDFAKAVRVDGTYNDQSYLWFYNRLTTNALSDSRFGTMFLDWGAELYGLTPDTDYIYRIQDGEGEFSKTYKFKTAGAEEFSIIWMSDAHVNSGYNARLLAWRKMVTFAKSQAKYPVAFQFSTGDTLTSGDRYQDWLSVANETFTRNYMMANVIGNHDVYDAVMYADSTYYTQYWKGGQYFEIVYNNPRNGYTHTSQRINGYLAADGYTQYAGESANELFTVSGGALDGKLISGAEQNLDGRAYWFNYNGLLFIIFDYYEMMFAEDTAAALEWAGNVIEQNYGKFDYIICANHINLVNGGGGAFRDYGAVDYECFQPFFDKYGVDVFLAGDNHVYLRTSAIYNGEVSTDPNKGTYIIQAPCLSRPQSFSAYDAAGYADKQYSVGGSTEGGLVIDVDENGLTFRCLVNEKDRPEIQYYEYDSFTVPKREKAPAAQVGYYAVSGALDCYTAPDAEYFVGSYTAPVESGIVYVYDTYMQYGLVAAEDMPIWVDLSDFTYICGDNRENPIGYVQVSTALTEITAEDGLYSGATFTTIMQNLMTKNDASQDATIEELLELLDGRSIYVLDTVSSLGDNIYSISTVYNAENIAELAFDDAQKVLVTTPALSGSTDTVYDAVNGNMLYCTNLMNFDEIVPEGIIISDEADLTVADGKAEIVEGTSVEDLEAMILNASIVVTDKDGNELKYYNDITDGATVTVYNGDSATAVGSFTVTLKLAYLLGDVNFDGEVDSLDAAAVLKYDAGILASIENGDVNGDGETDSLDAAAILKYDAGIITEF